MLGFFLIHLKEIIHKTQRVKNSDVGGFMLELDCQTFLFLKLKEMRNMLCYVML
jgi:hypothetical protein